jgi:hypothetical protein
MKFLAFAALITAPGLHAAAPLLAPMDSVMRRVAVPAGFTPLDLDLLVNFRTAPPPAPAVVTGLLRQPQGMDSLLHALRGGFSWAWASGGPIAQNLWPWLGARPLNWPWKFYDWRLIPRTAPDTYLDSLHPSEISFLLREAPGLFRQREEDTLLNPIERELERVRGDAVTDSVMRLASKIPLEDLEQAGLDMDALLFFLLDMAKTKGPNHVMSQLPKLGRNKGIPVFLGTPGNDVHRLDRGIVFDPGGNDRYVFPDSARPGSWLMVIDLEGDDSYEARDTVGAAAGFLSAQVIADLKGNDRYIGQDFAFGSAMMGYARLYDAEGDDVYEGRCASLGFAFHGIGILQDRAGNDSYSSAYMSQAASSSFGLAVLLDEAGNDSYVSRPVFVDDIRYRDHFLSLSQGFSTGMAPRHGGGIAVLWDRAGDDSYSADIFGQGAGYWFGWGLLMDDAGNDRYQAHQYAQGAGVHFAVGALIDEAGDDTRISKGVSQGCGHDGGFGLLVDEAGDDSTTAVDMSAGAGSANGLGVYADFLGDDVYTMGNPAMTLGHGDMRRDRGSTGFFWDARGLDSYPVPPQEKTGFVPPPLFPKNNAAWRVYDGQRKGYGHGLDAENEQ